MELTRINGTLIMAETPQGDENLILAARKDEYGYEYIVSTWKPHQHFWGQGNYFRTFEAASTYYQSRGGK